ncbi:MAG: hypothetical protein EHM87_01490 [Burkholderiales bacterium]|nr:MAG: hypothetical protein EHM87_01490 [Burkholderiales bacterium]
MHRPIRALAALAAAALPWTVQAQASGDWIHDAQKSFYAATVNDSGNVFGQWCDPQDRSCTYLVAFTASCRDGARYPAVANGEGGADAVTLVCRGALDGRNAEGRPLFRYAFENFDQIDTLVRGSKRIGIAFPIDGDAFRVLRFSLAGSQTAIGAMRGAIERGGRQNTRDLRL